VFRSSLLYVWVTRGPFGRLMKSLCDFDDMTPHTLVGGAQTTLTARASVRADRRNDPRESLILFLSQNPNQILIFFNMALPGGQTVTVKP
jgi:hypothetical protein